MKIQIEPLNKLLNKPITNKPVNSLKRNKDRAYIIAGGTSINPSYLNKLKDGDTIVVNKSIEYVDLADFFITIDYSALSTRIDLNQIKTKAKNKVFIVNKYHPYMQKMPDGIYCDTRFNIKYDILKDFDYVIESKTVLNSVTGFGLSFDTFSNGENSGFCAIQFAILLGYKEIYLLGIDLNIKGTTTHFHNAYPNTNHFRKNLTKYQKTFDLAFSKLPKNILNTIISGSQISYLNKYIPYKNVDLLATNYERKETANKVIKHQIISQKNSTIENNSKAITIKPRDDRFMDLLVVGYFTLNTPYEEEKNKLIKSIEKFGLGAYIKGIPTLGDWQKNTRYKANFMLEMLDIFPDKRLLYVDCDAEFNTIPELFINYSCDIAIRWQNFSWKRNESLSGTIYMENNDRTKLLCKKWIDYNIADGPNPKNMEQHNLGKLIIEMSKTHKLTHKNLIPEYCFVFDNMRKIYPNAVAVIEHYQASRRFKKIINSK